VKFLEVSNVRAGYGEGDILKDVSVCLEKHEIVAIVGANGCGKSTLLKAIGGVVKTKSGSISFQGKPIQGKAPHEISAQGLSYVPQSANVFPSLTVEENLLIAAGKSLRQKQKDEVYEIFPQLAGYRKRRAGLLSGGGRQMLGIGMGLMSDPRLLLLDEPTAALSPLAAQTILDTVANEIHSRGVGVLIVEQRVQEVLKIAQRAYVMADGKVVKEAPASSLTDDTLIELFLGGAAA
jgi:branched-chain amino acid transport system ATP-binding protein